MLTIQPGLWDSGIKECWKNTDNILQLWPVVFFSGFLPAPWVVDAQHWGIGGWKLEFSYLLGSFETMFSFVCCAVDGLTFRFAQDKGRFCGRRGSGSNCFFIFASCVEMMFIAADAWCNDKRDTHCWKNGIRIHEADHLSFHAASASALSLRRGNLALSARRRMLEPDASAGEVYCAWTNGQKNTGRGAVSPGVFQCIGLWRFLHFCAQEFLQEVCS